MTVIMKIMNKKKVIMTSPTVFRPLSLTHLHGDRFFSPPTLHSGCHMAALITLFMVNQALCGCVIAPCLDPV